MGYVLSRSIFRMQSTDQSLKALYVRRVRNLIKKLGKNHTLIISSHILSEISQICERVIIINKGQIVAVDSPEHLEDTVNIENAINIIKEK